MSRSGYSDDCEQWDLIRWRGAVNSAIRGKRGQALLRELAEALDAMPVKELIAEELEADGQFCALGCVGAKRGLDMAGIDPEDRAGVAKTFGVAEALAAEIMDVNDRDYNWDRYKAKTVDEMHAADRRNRETRWAKVRAWVEEQIAKEPK